jgi:ribosome biogenesis GTPase A
MEAIMKKIKVILELDIGHQNNKQKLRKETSIYLYPFPGLIIDDDDYMSRKNMGIVTHQIVVKSVRSSMAQKGILCYCGDEIFETDVEMQERMKFLLIHKWHYYGSHG